MIYSLYAPQKQRTLFLLAGLEGTKKTLCTEKVRSPEEGGGGKGARGHVSRRHQGKEGRRSRRSRRRMSDCGGVNPTCSARPVFRLFHPTPPPPPPSTSLRKKNLRHISSLPPRYTTSSPFPLLYFLTRRETPLRTCMGGKEGGEKRAGFLATFFCSSHCTVPYLHGKNTFVL